MNALERAFEANRLLRSITAKAHDAATAMDYNEDAAPPIITYLAQDARLLKRMWPIANSNYLAQLDAAVKKATGESMDFIANELSPLLAEEFDAYTHELRMSQSTEVLEGMLHPVILASSYSQFRDGYYRDAVFNSIVAVFDLIRKCSGLDKDGATLVNEAFSLTSPILIFTTLDSESGLNEQKGFMEILRGTYQGIRNPNAHSLGTDLDEHKAAQYLIFASLLACRVSEAVKKQ